MKLMVVIAVPLNAESNISEVGSEVMNNPSGVAAAAAEWLRAISLRNLVFLIVVFFFFPPTLFLPGNDSDGESEVFSALTLFSISPATYSMPDLTRSLCGHKIYSPARKNAPCSLVMT